MTDDSLEARKFRAADARALLDNKLFNSAWDRLNENFEAQALACDPDNKDKAARIIVAKQILAGLKREFKRLIEDGDVADIQLAEIEQKRRLFKFYR